MRRFGKLYVGWALTIRMVGRAWRVFARVRVRECLLRFFALGFLLVGWRLVAEVSDPIEALKVMSLEDLTMIRVDTVIGASKHEQKISDAPANVTILTSEEFKFYGWRTLGEAMRSVSGTVVAYDRSYGYLGFRGFNQPGDYSGRVLVTVDGHRMNDAMFDSSAMNTDFILDPDLIEKVEIIRGPGSVLYGNNALFGVINIITRKGRDVHGTELSGSYGSFDTFTGRATYGNRFTNGVELMFSTSIYDSRGDPSLYYPEFSSINHGLAEHIDGSRAPSVFVNLSWKDFSFEGGYVDRSKRIPTAPFSTPEAEVVFNDPIFQIIDERAFADLKFEHEFESDWQLGARIYYDSYRYDGWYPFNYTPADPLGATVINYDLDQSQSIGNEIQVSKTLFSKHRVIVGAEARYDYQLKVFNEDIDPQYTYLNVNQYGYFAGVYANDEFHILDNLILDAGARYDTFRNADATIDPRAALIYHPWKPSTFKLLYGQAYRAPTAYESYYNWPIPTNTPAINAETIRTYEAVYEHEFNQVWNAKVSLFCNELDNMISSDANRGLANVESVETRGLETEVAARWPSYLQARVSYSYADARNKAAHQVLANAPEHLAKLNLAVPLWRDRLFASAEVQLMSSRETVQGGRVDGFWLMNTTLFSRELVKGVELSASIYNLLDQHYSDPASSDFLQSAIAQDGRTFRLKVTWRF